MRGEVMRAKVWRCIRKKTGSTIRAICEEAQVPYKGCYCYVRGLERRGYVEKTLGRDSEGFISETYQLTRNTGPIAPGFVGNEVFDPNLANQPGPLSQRLWRQIRVAKGIFPMAQLVACTGASQYNVARYLGWLTKSGYLEILPAKPGVARAYRLIRDTGPAAPLPDGGKMYDPNEDKYYGEEQCKQV